MDSPTERMPIACVQCAKAKAKCDKKVPCSRCVGKQIICQSRATRRSSHMPSRRHHNLPRNQSEHALHTAASFHVSQLSVAPPDGSVISRSNHNPHPMHQHRLSLPDLDPQMHGLGGGLFCQDMEPQLVRTGFTQTPPDMQIPITPIMQNMPVFDNTFVSMNGNHFDPDNEQFLSFGTGQNAQMEFDMSSMLDFTSPPGMMYMADPMGPSEKGGVQTPSHVPLLAKEGPTPIKSRPEMESFHQHVLHRMPSTSPPSPLAMGLQEPDAVLASQASWPFFQCNPLEKNADSPPKTASIYLEGLAQTLKNQDTWKSWTAQSDQRDLDRGLDRKVITQEIVGWSREKLIAITQGFLHKALDIHKAAHHISREGSPRGSTESGNAAILMLPPSEVIQYFLKSYVVRHEPYYANIPGGVLNPNELLQLSNGKVSSLLVLLMVAAGATTTPTVEARYIASGLTEACRISLFDVIEKDIYQAKDLLVLRSALLFTSLAVWSGDKWHMDIAMGQRNMYLSMLAHGGMLDARYTDFDLSDSRRDSGRHWEEWKEQEAKSRLAHSWVILDQEMSLFSDTPPLLLTVNLQTPVPDSEELWQVSTAAEWLTAFENVHGATYKSPPSVRELFTRFVEGELEGSSVKLSPTQLRLLLHPLQSQVCQLRQFLSCLPDHGKVPRAVSRAATKARLEEIAALLQQWYSLAKQSFVISKSVCWTTCANLIMYHLISLNAITSFRCIEQFARREVALGSFRHASWLQMRCIDRAEETVFHCGQVLRLIRSMPEPVRPSWWSGAVYRVALVGWVNSIANAASRFSTNGQMGDENRPFPVDNLTPEDPAITQYLKYQEGVPMLTKSDGSLISMDIPANILTHCIGLLDEDSTMRLTDGIRRKLRMLVHEWRDNGMSPTSR